MTPLPKGAPLREYSGNAVVMTHDQIEDTIGLDLVLKYRLLYFVLTRPNLWQPS